jgi:hypothetical protein
VGASAAAAAGLLPKANSLAGPVASRCAPGKVRPSAGWEAAADVAAAGMPNEMGRLPKVNPAAAGALAAGAGLLPGAPSSSIT